VGTDIDLGNTLSNGVDHGGQLLNVAADHASDAHARRADLARMLFPSAIVPPSEATINAVSIKLQHLVTDIEAAILSAERAQPSRTWSVLLQSDFLRDADLIDFVLARASEDAICKRAGLADAPLPRALLNHDNAQIANAAQALLAAESLHAAAGRAYLVLRPELLHKLCWRIAAALEVLGEAKRVDLTASVRAVLARYSEADCAFSAAARIAHLCSESERRAMLVPTEAGVQLHVAALSAMLDIDQDFVAQLLDGGSSAPYAAMLGALGVQKRQAVEAIFILRADRLTPAEAGLIGAGFDDISVEAAAEAVRAWALDRARMLAESS
jgi:hypothetical protein